MKSKDNESVFDMLFDKEEALDLNIRAELLSKLQDNIKERKLTQHELSKILDVPQSRISDLVNGKLDKFSISMLIKFAFRLGLSVEVKVA